MLCGHRPRSKIPPEFCDYQHEYDRSADILYWYFWIYSDKYAARPLHLVFKLSAKLAPTLIKIDLFKPDFALTFFPGACALPRADLLIFLMRKSSTTTIALMLQISLLVLCKNLGARSLCEHACAASGPWIFPILAALALATHAFLIAPKPCFMALKTMQGFDVFAA